MSWAEAKYILDNTDNSSLKKVQRGSTSGAATVTISAVDMSKAIVLSVSKGSSGYVAARGTVGSASISSGSISGSVTGTLSGSFSQGLTSPGYGFHSGTTSITLSGTRSLSGSMSGTVSASSISGGSTDLTVRQYSATLTSATSLYCDGAVEWQVIEFN